MSSQALGGRHFPTAILRLAETASAHPTRLASPDAAARWERLLHWFEMHPDLTPLERVDELITDASAEPDHVEALRRSGTRVSVAPEGARGT